MAEILRFCDPNAEAGGDGTTNALTGGSCAYVSLNAWEAATQQDLTDGGGDTARVVCSSDDAGSTHAADTTVVTINGWTTSATCFITVEAASSHGGKWNDGRYRLTISDVIALNIYEDYVNLIGLQVATLNPTASARHVVGMNALSASNMINISKCILVGHGSNTHTQRGIYSATNSVINIWNCTLYNFYLLAATLPIFNNISTATLNIYSSTVIGGQYGIRQTFGTINAKNCYVGGSLSGDISGTITQTTCATSDTTATGTALDSIAVNTTNFTNVTPGSEDFHLPAGSALIDVGTDTSGDGAPLNFTDDIDGVARTGTWDIGADEYVAAAVSLTPTIGAQSLAGIAGRMDLGMSIPTEVNIA